MAKIKRVIQIFFGRFRFLTESLRFSFPGEWQVCIVCFSGVDELLARHIAHLFIRDPVSLFSEKINQDDENDTDHFEVSGSCKVRLKKILILRSMILVGLKNI